MEYPNWYTSSQGPKVSKTVTNVGLGLLPVVNMVTASFGVGALGEGTLNAVVSAVVFLYFAVQALVGYVRSRRTAEAELGSLRREVERLGGAGNKQG